MSTQEIANRLVTLCRAGEYETVYEELFDKENVLSVEPENGPNNVVKGIAAIKEKGAAFNKTLEALHSSYVTDPLVAGNSFSLAMGLEATFSDKGRVKMDEICVYEVKNGKIVKEQFFF
jgi:hypothetical protein